MIPDSRQTSLAQGYTFNMNKTVDISSCFLNYKSYTCSFVYVKRVLVLQNSMQHYRECKISLVLLGVAFRPMKRERKQLREIWQKVFGNVIDCRWQSSGGLFGPQWFFVMARPAIIQQDKAVFECMCVRVCLCWHL